VAGGGYAGYRYWKRPAAPPVEYRTATVSRGDIVQAVTANGSLNPVRNVEVGSQISGIITKINVDFNSKVKAGDVIAQIDPATYERALVQAEAELANAQAALELAQLNFDRAQELFANNLISKSEFDQAKVNLSQAEAVVKMRRANVERAKVDLDRTTIYAPIDGVVISRRVEEGQTVAASLNAPTLFVIANDLSRMQIEAAVSEADVGGVEEGQKVTFTVDAFMDRKFEGIVKQVRYAPVTNQNVVTYTTVVEVENRDLKLRPGMTANASIITAERRGVLTIPAAALRFRPPEGAIVRAETNTPAGGTNAWTTAAPQTEIATSGPFAGLPVPPWQAGGQRRRPTEEERAAYEASLTPEQKARYQQIMAEFRARFAQGGGPGGGFRGGGGGFGNEERPRRSEPDRPRSQTIYLLEKEKTVTGGERPVLKPVTVKLGISDGANVEVLDGLKEGDVVVTGTITRVAEPAVPAGGSSPFDRRPRFR
jgi:HlyD family secretion protein